MDVPVEPMEVARTAASKVAVAVGEAAAALAAKVAALAVAVDMEAEEGGAMVIVEEGVVAEGGAVKEEAVTVLAVSATEEVAGEGLAPVMGTAVRWVVVEAPTVARETPERAAVGAVAEVDWKADAPCARTIHPRNVARRRCHRRDDLGR